MNSPSKAKTLSTEDKSRLKHRIANDADGIADYVFPFHYPVKLLGDIMAAIFRLVSPYTPNLIPLAVFLLALPVIVFLSVSAGWLVWKSVAVAWEVDLPLQYGDGVPPYAEIILSNVITKQPYDISLHVVAPATDANFALGNFMTSLTIATPSNRTLAYIRKPSIVVPRSSAPWSFLYNWPGTIDLNVPLLQSFSVDAPRAIARVEIGRRDLWKSIGNGQGRELSVLSAVLRGAVVHTGIKGLVAQFPIISSLAAAATFLFLSFIILASCLLPALELRFNNDLNSNDPPPPRLRKRPRRRLSMSVADTDDQRTRRPKPQNRSRSTSVPRRQRSTRTPEPRIKEEPQVELDPLDTGLSLESPGPFAQRQADMQDVRRHDVDPWGALLTGSPHTFGSDTSTLVRRRSRTSEPEGEGLSQP